MTQARIDTHLLLFHGDSGYANEPEGYVIRASPILFLFSDICYHTCFYVYTLTKEHLSDFAPVVQGGGVSLRLTGQTVNISTSLVLHPTLSHKRTCIHTFAMCELSSVNGAIISQGSIPS